MGLLDHVIVLFLVLKEVTTLFSIAVTLMYILKMIYCNSSLFLSVLIEDYVQIISSRDKHICHWIQRKSNDSREAVSPLILACSHLKDMFYFKTLKDMNYYC